MRRIHCRLPLARLLFGAAVALVLGSNAVALAHPMSGLSEPVDAASGDPTVLVARDMTPYIRCQLSWGIVRGGQDITLRTTACPSGTDIETVRVPLSEALARRESYVVLPLGIPYSQWPETVKQQIFGLIAAENAKFHRTHDTAGLNLGPQSCSGSDIYVQGKWSPYWDTATTYQSYMYYESCSSNQIYCDYSTIQATQVSGSLYDWDHDQYAAGWWGRNDQAIGTYKLEGGMGSTHQAGNYYEPYVVDSYGDSDYHNIGPAYE